MKAAPACLLLISFLSTSLFFAQEHITNSKLETTKNNNQKSIRHSTKTFEEKLISYTEPLDLSESTNTNTNTKSKKTDIKRKTTLQMTETTQTSVPRTTIDFF
ncbi:hypothetical protein [Aquimarina sp. SS2-1]|uniref:hypothetical protein n=1 Tax=Aquimarina besae TaxID=3342247 RepID=UPI003670AD15